MATVRSYQHQTDEAVHLLRQLIAIPSFSKEEKGTADLLFTFFDSKGHLANRDGNNIWVANKYFDSSKPTVLLNSHHDTVRPNTAYTRDPFHAEVADGKLYGLGSNDAGGPLVSLIEAFLFFNEKQLPFNLIMAATAEEEISGKGGIESILSKLPSISLAIVGEPTTCQMAIAEKGLMVLDCIVHGKAGHAAREEGVNAIYKALNDIEWFRTYSFKKHSDLLGDVKMTVTMVSAGMQHNMVPAECRFTVDVRVTDVYTLEEVLDEIQQQVGCIITPRSMRIRPSGISREHAVVKAAAALDIPLYGSPTTSDQALIPAPSVKIGPGDSARSHSADEFIFVDEIAAGIDTYIRLIDKLTETFSINS